MRFTRDTFTAGFWFLGCFEIRQFFWYLFGKELLRLITFDQVCSFFSIGSIFCGFKIRIHNSCTYKFPNSHDRRSWLAPAKSESYLLTFLLFAFWCCNFLSRGAQTKNSRWFDCPENIFSSVKLPTLYPGYVLKGEVHHSMRGLF